MKWSTKKLGEITKRFKLVKAPFNSWPYIEIGDINLENKSIVFKDKKSIKGAVIAPKNSVLVSRVRPTRGAIVLTDKDYSVSSAFTILEAKRAETSSKFLFYWIGNSKNFFVYLSKKQKGSNYPSVREKDVLNFQIPLPPLKIQKQIVGRLDKIVEAQKLNEGLIQKADELFQSLLHKELDPAGKDWEVKKLGDVCEINPSKKEINGSPNGLEVGFLTMADVSSEAGIINIQIRKLKDVKKGFTYFRNGDVLFAKITPCMENGKGAFVEGMKNDIGFGSTEFHVLRATPKLLSNKLLYFIISDRKFRQKAKRFMRGAVGQQRVPSDYLEKFKVYLPSITEQKQIIAKLSAVQDYKTQLFAQKSKLKELFDSVLAKSLRGDL